MNKEKSGKKSASITSSRRGSRSSNASKSDITEVTTTTTTEKVEKSETKINGNTIESSEIKESSVVIENMNSNEALTQQEIPKENVESKTDENNAVDDTHVVDGTQSDVEKMEPLIYESDETESELEKLSAESSDIDSDKCKQQVSGSPVLNRSTTRRSDFRNIPTPKTPKAVVVPINGASEEVEIQDTGKEETDTDVKLTQQTTVVIEKIQTTETIEEINISESTENGTTANNSDEICDKSDTLESNGYSRNDDDIESSTGSVSVELQNLKDTSSIKSTPDVSVSSLENISVAAVYSGDNTTQNIDFTIIDDQLTSNDASTDSRSQFVEQTRDLSYIKTLKVISGRKTLRDLRQASFNNIQKKHLDSPRIGKVQGQPRDVNLKRKGDSYVSDVELDYSKRIRVDDSNGNDSGILSYVSSPINMLKMKFANSSTPIRSNSIDYESNRYSEEINAEAVNNTSNKANSWCTVQ